jgi:hypothetical protein
MRIIWILVLLLGGCSKFGKIRHPDWEVGQWVSYKINSEPLKISIVGRDSSLFWVETVEPELIVKVLVRPEEINHPIRLIVKRTGENPTEFQETKLSIESNFTIQNLEDSGKEEVLILPCGKIKTIHIEREETDIWLSSTIPILGVVKYTNKNMNIVLQSYGMRGATSEIKEPVENVSL